MDLESDIQSGLERMTGQPTAQGPEVMVVEVDSNQGVMSPDMIAAQGLGMAQQYMASNGPTTPNHLRKRVVMTKAQLEEQKMNEKSGYPSNLEEASKVKNLESKVEGIEQGIQAILRQMSGGTPVGPPPECSPPTPTPKSTPSCPVSDTQPDLATQPSPASPGVSVTSQYFQTIPGPPSPSPTDSGDSTSPRKRRVKLSNGRTVEMSGPVQPSDPTMPSPEIPPTTRNLSLGPLEVEEPQVPKDDSDLWVEESNVPFQNDPKLEKLALLVRGVSKILQTRDPLTFFRRALPKVLHRQMGFSAWPESLRTRFTRHFVTLLSDPVFVKTQVSMVLSFEFGYGIGHQKVAELVVLTAGFMALSLAGAEAEV